MLCILLETLIVLSGITNDVGMWIVAFFDWDAFFLVGGCVGYVASYFFVA
jgi:hypothetical protein